jgi:hypothetical protein
MRIFQTMLLGSLGALMFAGTACSSSSDTDPSNPTVDAGFDGSGDDASTDSGADATPEASVESGVDAAQEAEVDGSNDDLDGDGIPNGADDCPNEAEDLDGWEDEDGCPDPNGSNGTLPALTDQSGVVYAVHFNSNELIWYRTDGATPRREAELDMGEFSHDSALDPIHDNLYVVHDVAKKVEVYQLARPADAASPTPQPTLLSTIEFDEGVYFARVNPYRQRLYVLQSLPGTGGPATEAALFIFDVSDPSAPVIVDGAPHTVPSTASLDIDPVRDLLFLYHGPTGTLHGFDLHGDAVVSLGAELDLEALYPQENSYAFQARNLTVDPHSHRIYAARPQGNLSELIAIEYPAAIPTGGATWGEFGSMSDLSVVADPFDVDLPMDQRPHLLDAFTPVPDPRTGALFLVGSSWNGTASTALVVSMPTTIDQLDPGCGAFEGFGCWYRSHSNTTPGTYVPTDGAACTDATHQVFVGTSIDQYDETNPGMLHLFRYDNARNLTVLLPDDGGNISTGALAVAVQCH